MNPAALLPRRRFLRQAALGLLAVPSFAPASALGRGGSVAPSERIVTALIGAGCMGSGHLQYLVGASGVQVLGVCDVDRARRDAGQRLVNDTYAAARSSGTYAGCLSCNDYRELLARSDLDAVLIATPDHWHALQSVEAARAGKDVYCEKPVSVTLQEGREIVKAVRRYGRVFQTGTQYRSIPVIRQVCEFVRAGGLGRIKAVFTTWQNLGCFLGGRATPYAQDLGLPRAAASYVPLPFHLPAQPAPDGLDWERWVGPAPWNPYHPLYHINPSPGVVPWSFSEDFGVASSTWFHSHAADVIQYGLGLEQSGPVEILHPAGGQFPTVTCRYANGVLLHHVDHWGMVKDLYHALPTGARPEGLFGGLFIGERGWVTSMSGGGPVQGGPPDVLEELQLRTREVNIGANSHHANFFASVRNRLPPSAHEEIGHRAAALGHLVIICHRLGRSLQWDPVAETFIGDDTANRWRARAQREPWLF